PGPARGRRRGGLARGRAGAAPGHGLPAELPRAAVAPRGWLERRGRRADRRAAGGEPGLDRGWLRSRRARLAARAVGPDPPPRGAAAAAAAVAGPAPGPRGRRANARRRDPGGARARAAAGGA